MAGPTRVQSVQSLHHPGRYPFRVMLGNHRRRRSAVHRDVVDGSAVQEPERDVGVSQNRQVSFSPWLFLGPFQTSFVQDRVEHVPVIGSEEVFFTRPRISYSTSRNPTLKCSNSSVHRPAIPSASFAFDVADQKMLARYIVVLFFMNRYIAKANIHCFAYAQTSVGDKNHIVVKFIAIILPACLSQRLAVRPNCRVKLCVFTLVKPLARDLDLLVVVNILDDRDLLDPATAISLVQDKTQGILMLMKSAARQGRVLLVAIDFVFLPLNNADAVYRRRAEERNQSTEKRMFDIFHVDSTSFSTSDSFLHRLDCRCRCCRKRLAAKRCHTSQDLRAPDAVPVLSRFYRSRPNSFLGAVPDIASLMMKPAPHKRAIGTRKDVQPPIKPTQFFQSSRFCHPLQNSIASVCSLCVVLVMLV